MSPKDETMTTPAADEDESQGHAPHTGCGILGRYPVISVVLFAACGLALGIGLSTWEPSNPEDKETTVKWLGLIGDMFVRALKATVLPLVFVNVILSVVEMMSIGRASTVGLKAIGLYLLTTLIAAVIGIVTILVYKGLFKTEVTDSSGETRVQLGCDDYGGFLSHDMNGNVFCSANLTDDTSSYFSIEDVDGTFVQVSSGPQSDLSFSDTMYDGVFTKMITSNIFESFVEANFAAVVLFAIAMGAALGSSLFKRRVSIEENIFVLFLKEVDSILITLIHWIIMITPIAVFSLIVSAVGAQTNLNDSLSNVGYLCLAVLSGFAVHLLIVYPAIYYVSTGGKNPFHYYRYIVPAQTTAFACASSAATMPVTLECAEASGQVPKNIARFVIPLGATINMDGSAIYIPCTCVWLAILNGIEPSIGNYVLLVIVATIGSAGTAPVPSAGLVIVLTAYNSVFGTSGSPMGFEFVIATDWLLDRFVTIVNVSGDSFVAASIAALVSLDDAEELEPEGTSTSKPSTRTAMYELEGSEEESPSYDYDV